MRRHFFLLLLRPQDLQSTQRNVTKLKLGYFICSTNISLCNCASFDTCARNFITSAFQSTKYGYNKYLPILLKIILVNVFRHFWITMPGLQILYEIDKCHPLESTRILTNCLKLLPIWYGYVVYNNELRRPVTFFF